MAAKTQIEEAGNPDYRQQHFKKLFQEGFSFSGYERDCLYQNTGGGEFVEISGISGIDSITDGRGAVFGDFDNDGDLDVFLTTIQGEAHLLFRNNVGSRSGFLRVVLQGTESGKDAYGAVVRVKTSAGVLMKFKSGGAGFLSQHDPRVLFGLGADRQAEWIEIAWPSGLKQRFDNIAANTCLKVVEGKPSYEVLREERFELVDPLSPEERILTRLKVGKGSLLPDVEVVSLDNQGKSLRAIIQRGRRHFINLWATWCASCATEMPELERLRERFQSSNIQVIGLSLDTEGPEAVKTFLDRHGIRYPNYVADESLIEGIYSGEEVFVPLSLLVDEQGRIVDVLAGWSNDTLARVSRVFQRW